MLPLPPVPPLSEEITTIFIVGFPDDMQEREFQNLFVFHPGFEAASLKRPSCNYAASSHSPIEVDPSAPAAVHQFQQHFLINQSYHHSQPISDSSDIANNFNSNNNLAKKPIIGFAKFRTRDDAAKAIEVLNGRKLDAESSIFLKVEMARKNLVSKRIPGIATNHAIVVNNADSVNPLPVASNIYSSFDSVAISQISSSYGDPVASASSLSPSAPLYNLSSWRPSLVSPVCSSASSASEFSNHTRRSSSDLSDLESLDSLNGGNTLINNNNDAGKEHVLFRSLPPQFSALGKSTLDPPVVVSAMDSPHSSNYFGSGQRDDLKTLEDEILFKLQAPVKKTLPDVTSLQMPFALNAARATSFHEANVRTEQQKVSAIPLQQRSVTDMFGVPGQYPGNTLLQSPVTPSAQNMVTSPQQQKNSPLPAPPVNARAIATVPDQNPPCNTLYVGNLPPDTQETELRQLFSGAPGFKRMCFKPKPGNGPMCFVEFDNSNFSTMALNELQGSLLSNSARGGIRISYSKNPLGVRQISPTLASQAGAPIEQFPAVPQPHVEPDMAARRNNSHSTTMTPMKGVAAESRSFSFHPNFEQGDTELQLANRLISSRSIPQLRVDTSSFGLKSIFQQGENEKERSPEPPKPLLNSRINSLLVQALHNRANNEPHRVVREPRSASTFGMGGGGSISGGGNKPFMSAWFSQTMIKG